MVRGTHLLTAILALAVPAAAEACRVPIPLEQRIAAWHAEGLFSTTAIVDVTGTGPIEDPWGETRTYARDARVLAVSGEPLPVGGFSFGEDLLISSCGWQNNVEAQVGDRIVVYLTRSPAEDAAIFLALPLTEAVKRDPQIRSFWPEG